MERNGILLAGKRVLFTITIGLLCSLSLSADYKLVLTDVDGNQTQECVKSYSFSNNLESIANQSSVSKDIYSEAETLTNKIYLGKPVYRKVYTFDDYVVPKNNSGISKYTDIISTEMDSLVDLNFKGYNGDYLISENYTKYVIYNNAQSIYIEAGYQKSTKKAYVFIRNALATWNITDLKITVEYTKTTDTVNITPNKFQSYLIYKLSSSTSDEVITKDMENLGVQLLKGYSYDASTNSCTKN